MKCFNQNEIKKNFVRGQYDGGGMNNEFVPAYRNEPNVDSQSNTETFVAGKIEIENSKWASVTFFIFVQKKEWKKSIQIVIECKKSNAILL